MKRIAVKVDIDTLRGYREGVPRLLDLFKRKGIRASLFFSLGPDNSGKAIRRIFRRGFLAKMIRTKAPSTYGLKTLLYGTLLPAPMIAASAPEVMQRAADEGHDCGVHCWDHVFWQDKLPTLTVERIAQELNKAVEIFEKYLHTRPLFCGAPGWQVTLKSLKVQQEMGFDYCSDVRGRFPFYPAMSGTRFNQLQIPGTLPTMDEALGLPGITDESLPAYWLSLCGKPWDAITVHAEMEGLSKLSVFERFIDIASEADFSFGPLSDALDNLKPTVCEVYPGYLPGRSGTVAIQGKEIEDQVANDGPN